MTNQHTALNGLLDVKISWRYICFTRTCAIVAGVFFEESPGSGILGNLLRGMNNQILVILVEVQTSLVANSGKEAQWRKFAQVQPV